jgi:hypothetical protein
LLTRPRRFETAVLFRFADDFFFAMSAFTRHGKVSKIRLRSFS